MSLGNNILVLSTIFATSGALFRLNKNGPTHINYAIKCLEQIAVNNFHYMDEEGQLRNESAPLLITFFTTKNMSPPAHEIQENFLKTINNMLRWNLETTVSDEDYDFEQSCDEFGEADCDNPFIEALHPKFYVIIVDTFENYLLKLDVLINTEEFNRRSPILVYFSNPTSNQNVWAERILGTLWNKAFSFNNLAVIPQHDFRHFNFYTMKFEFTDMSNCLQIGSLKLVGKCEKGVLSNNDKYFQRKDRVRKFKNCTVDVIAMPIEPFVITETSGFEIKVLRQIGRTLNITLNITVVKNLTDADWGEKVDGEWNQNLGVVDKRAALGIGNIYANPDYAMDFDFCIPHFRADLVWIVPVADYVPRWRVLTIIFSWELWAVCIGLILVCGSLFCVLSRLNSKVEYNFYKSLRMDFFTAFQVLITAAVFKHPRSDFTRLIFVALAIFSIIISSVYTSSLINYLTTRKRLHQIDNLEEILENGLHIGGMPVFRSIFNASDDETSMHIFDIYEVDDDLEHWLRRVGYDRDTATIYTDFYVNYLISKSDGNVTFDDKRPRVYIIKKKIMFYNLRIIMKKGFPFLSEFNDVINAVTRAGLVINMVEKYFHALKKIEQLSEDEASAQPLKVIHLQAPFAVLILGYILGAFIMALEFLVYFIKKRIEKKRKEAAQDAVKRRQRQIKKQPSKQPKKHKAFKKVWRENKIH